MNKTYLPSIVIALVLLGMFFLFIQKPKGKETGPQKLHVVASFYAIYFFASEIGGTQAEVINITPSGIEPHDYEPTPQDIVRIAQSQIILLNGVGFEAWGEHVQKNLDPSKTKVVYLGDALATQTLTEENETRMDPHIWLSPTLATQIVKNILHEFIDSDPNNSAYYTNNARIVTEKLAQLDDSYRRGFAHCDKKDFVTSHAAFGYLAHTYGLTQTPIAGLSPNKEPSAKELAAITHFIREREIPVIFFESLASPKLSETLARETSAITMVLDPIEGLTPEDVRAGENYFTIMTKNLENLRIALKCTAQ